MQDSPPKEGDHHINFKEGAKPIDGRPKSMLVFKKLKLRNKFMT